MFGLRFVKFQPTTYVLKYENGAIVKEGAGLSFFYYAPVTSLVAVPLESTEAPFIFEEVSADYQAITVQGIVTYRIAEPSRIARLLNFTLANSNHQYASDDPKKLGQRIVNTVKVLISKQVQLYQLRDLLKAVDGVAAAVTQGLRKQEELVSFGLEILSVSIIAIKPNKETVRALEAGAREQILKEADDAIYERRNASVEQERRIRENELNTEIAVENKKREIREAQVDAETAVQEKKHRLEAAETAFAVSQEVEKKKIVEIEVQNARSQAEVRAFEVSSTMNAFNSVSPAVVQALASVGMKPERLIAVAFQGLAENAQKIGQLNITPDLLQDLLKKRS